MEIGTQFRAPDGYRSLRHSVTYYFLRNHLTSGRALFCWFAKGKQGWRAYLTSLTSDDMEEALTQTPPLIVPVDHKLKLPPWLAVMDGTNFDEIECNRVSAKRTYRDQVHDRFQHIAALVSKADSLLTDQNIMRVLSAHARQCAPPQNPHRVQLWFFAYLAHGRNIWALKKPTFEAGHWSRESEQHRHTKFGRRCLHDGSAYGHPTHQMRDLILTGYCRRAGLGKRMTDIHVDTCVQDLGCKMEFLEGGKYRMYQPENLPFPSYYQFRQTVLAKFGIKRVQVTLYGAERVKHSLPHQGAFTESVSNLLEEFEVDAYRVGDRSKSMYSDEPMSVLCVARGICVASGEVVGIGLSLGSETSAAYRALLWSMASPKSKLGQMFGLPISDDQWPAQGLPLSYTSDRGPGSKDLATELEERFPMRELTPSQSGQSKACVESSQPRKTHFEGAARFRQSSLTGMEMARREVLRACSDNHTSIVSKRLTPNMINHFGANALAATPHNIWKYLSARGRTDSVSVPFDQAVRAFLEPVLLTVKNDGVWLEEMCFRSEALSQSPLLHRARPGLKTEVRGYVFPMCIRTVWIENEGQIMELDAVLRLRDDRGQLEMTLSQLADQSAVLAAIESRTRESSQAARAEYREVFKQAVGKEWDAGEMKSGSPKRPRGSTLHEEQQIKLFQKKAGRA